MNLTEIAIIIHSTQESEYIKGCKETLDRFGLHCEVKIFTPLLDPPELQEFMQKAPERGIKIFIATSSLQSKLAAMIAAYTHLPETRLAPHDVPVAAAGPSMQLGTPPVHAVTPVRHGAPVLPVHGALS